MTDAGRQHWLSLLATALTLLLLLFSAHLQIPIQQDISDQLQPDSLGIFSWGPAVPLGSGHYRARAVIALSRPAENGSGEPTGMVGFRPHGSPWGRETWLLREVEFARDGRRTLDLAFRVQEAGSYCWVWRGAPGENAFRLNDTRLFEELPWWAAAASEHNRPAAVSLLASTLSATLLLLLAGMLGARTVAGRNIGAGPSLPKGLLVYLLSGTCLLTAAAAIVGVSRSDRLPVRWEFFPGMFPSLEAWPMWLAAAIALVSAWAIGVSGGRRWGVLWALPVAALGLWFGSHVAGPRSDFQVYYTAGLALWDGVDPYSIRPERVLNPPPFVLATSIFPLLPLTWSGFLWFGVKAAAAVWCLLLARSIWSAPRENAGRRWFLRPEWIAFWISGRYVLMDLRYGNTNVLVLLSLLLLAAHWVRGQRGRAGVAVAAGTAVKLTPILAAGSAALAGRWRWAVATGLLGGMLLVLSAGILELRAEGAAAGFWRDVVAETGAMEMGRVDNQSLRGFTLRSVAGVPAQATGVAAVPSLGLGLLAARITEAILAAVVLGLLFRLGRGAARRGAGRAIRWAELWAGTALGMLLLSPGTWSVHYALIYLPVVALVDRSRRGQRSATVVLLLLAIGILLPVFSRPANDWFTALSLLPALSLGALWVLARGAPRAA